MVFGLYDAFYNVPEYPKLRAMLLTGTYPYTDGKYAFCLGGDQSIRGQAKYIDNIGILHLNIFELQSLIHSVPKVVIVLMASYVISGVIFHISFVL
nr:enoyl-CoA hydratase-related protein [cyanobacterium endosymbiont of Epithemia turgida]